MTNTSLLEVQDSLLIVIDIQPAFVKKENKENHNPLLQRMCWVIQVANWLDLPLVVTAEDIPHTGNISEEVAQVLPPNTKIYNKMTFGLTAQEDILAAVQHTERKTAVLIGYETDVCIAHSALGLMDLGYTVAVVADATGSRARRIKSDCNDSVMRVELSSAQRVCITNGSARWKSQLRLNLQESKHLRESFYEITFSS